MLQPYVRKMRSQQYRTNYRRMKCPVTTRTHACGPLSIFRMDVARAGG
ncbi:hypothetical protein CSUI_006921 [Cystoisospora suis]|uniref:Uncharacterized protein n=1 Tax=Cystoisospora suis TaxID=483139 RepID=A0A2C6KRT6_9APIC|nr:hypothetical protein CSUI_006921 [Cystoisospora suis]